MMVVVSMHYHPILLISLPNPSFGSSPSGPRASPATCTEQINFLPFSPKEIEALKQIVLLCPSLPSPPTGNNHIHNHEECPSTSHLTCLRFLIGGYLCYFLSYLNLIYALLLYEDFSSLILSLPFSSTHPPTAITSKLHLVSLLLRLCQSFSRLIQVVVSYDGISPCTAFCFSRI